MINEDDIEAPVFFRGEAVRWRMHPETTGQVINNRNWDREYLVRLSNGVELWFHDIELETYEVPDDGAKKDLPTVVEGGCKVFDLASARMKGAA